VINKKLELSVKLKLHSRSCNKNNLYSGYVFLLRGPHTPDVGEQRHCNRCSTAPARANAPDGSGMHQSSMRPDVFDDLTMPLDRLTRSGARVGTLENG
jgi:hypothetical protein